MKEEIKSTNSIKGRHIFLEEDTKRNNTINDMAKDHGNYEPYKGKKVIKKLERLYMQAHIPHTTREEY